MENAKARGSVEEFRLPEWETTARHRGEKEGQTDQKPSVKERAFIVFDHFMPGHRKYFGFSIKVLCIAIIVIFLVLLALILGLAIGLGRKSSQHQNLPLGSQTYTGDLTYYGPGLGACGVTSSDTDHIVSISHFTFDAASKGSNPNANPLCGHKLRAVRNGNSIDLTVVDRCVGCQPTDLDVSPGAFKELADPTLGRVEVPVPFAKTGDDRPSVVTVLYINLYTHKHFTCDLAGSERNQTQQSRANGVESFLLDSTTGIMNPMSTEALVWKLQGNTHCRDGKYLKAIECYDEALRRISNEEHAVILLLNRCQARLSSQHYDAALEDAMAVLGMDTTSEKALFRAARASYGLGCFARCRSYLAELEELYPENRAAIKDIERCEIRFREQVGEFDFAAMLDEAVTKQPSPRLDLATYIGPIEVRRCAIKSHGRGLFSTKAIKAGELILCEKAFTTAFAPDDSKSAAEIDHVKDSESDGSKWRLKLRAELAANTFVKLVRNPSVVSAFADLYPGPDADEEIDKHTNLPEVDDAFVQRRIIYNAFGFPSLTYEYHWKSGHTPDDLKDEDAGSIGVWIRASYINHSCYPLVRRTYIGDMMIFRAQADIPADTELKFGYISCLEKYEERQKMLEKWGFRCECQVCLAEKDYSNKKVKKRAKITEDIIGHFEKNTPTDLGVYNTLLDALDSTYINPSNIEPRKAMVGPIINLISACHSDGLATQLIELTLRMLEALGFETEITATSFKMTRWGFMVDEVVVALADMCDGYAAVNATLYDDVLEVAKTAYEIMCGERVSWDRTYGSERRGKLEDGVRDYAATRLQLG